jgi:hypothetical protein
MSGDMEESRDLIPDTIADFASGNLIKSARNLSRDTVVGTLTTVQAERSRVRIPAGIKPTSYTIFLNMLLFSTCFGSLCAHHQEK